ncbi:hypothetical protein DIPPA_34171 [Diplonema papillatum]|nr:hypothetical protein DIPPA_34171 [Diplonema papillatum]
MPTSCVRVAAAEAAALFTSPPSPKPGGALQVGGALRPADRGGDAGGDEHAHRTTAWLTAGSTGTVPSTANTPFYKDPPACLRAEASAAITAASTYTAPSTAETPFNYKDPPACLRSEASAAITAGSTDTAPSTANTPFYKDPPACLRAEASAASGVNHPACQPRPCDTRREPDAAATNPAGAGARRLTRSEMEELFESEKAAAAGGGPPRGAASETAGAASETAGAARRGNKSGPDGSCLVPLSGSPLREVEESGECRRRGMICGANKVEPQGGSSVSSSPGAEDPSGSPLREVEESGEGRRRGMICGANKVEPQGGSSVSSEEPSESLLHEVDESSGYRRRAMFCGANKVEPEGGLPVSLSPGAEVPSESLLHEDDENSGYRRRAMFCGANKVEPERASPVSLSPGAEEPSGSLLHEVEESSGYTSTSRARPDEDRKRGSAQPDAAGTEPAETSRRPTTSSAAQPGPAAPAEHAAANEPTAADNPKPGAGRPARREEAAAARTGGAPFETEGSRRDPRKVAEEGQRPALRGSRAAGEPAADDDAKAALLGTGRTGLKPSSPEPPNDVPAASRDEPRALGSRRRKPTAEPRGVTEGKDWRRPAPCGARAAGGEPATTGALSGAGARRNRTAEPLAEVRTREAEGWGPEPLGETRTGDEAAAKNGASAGHDFDARQLKTSAGSQREVENWGPKPFGETRTGDEAAAKNDVSAGRSRALLDFDARQLKTSEESQREVKDWGPVPFGGTRTGDEAAAPNDANAEQSRTLLVFDALRLKKSAEYQSEVEDWGPKAFGGTRTGDETAAKNDANAGQSRTLLDFDARQLKKSAESQSEVEDWGPKAFGGTRTGDEAAAKNDANAGQSCTLLDFDARQLKTSAVSQREVEDWRRTVLCDTRTAATAEQTSCALFELEGSRREARGELRKKAAEEGRPRGAPPAARSGAANEAEPEQESCAPFEMEGNRREARKVAEEDKQRTAFCAARTGAGSAAKDDAKALFDLERQRRKELSAEPQNEAEEKNWRPTGTRPTRTGDEPTAKADEPTEDCPRPRLVPEASRRKADAELRRDADSETPRLTAVGGAKLEGDEPGAPDAAAAHRPEASRRKADAEQPRRDAGLVTPRRTASAVGGAKLEAHRAGDAPGAAAHRPRLASEASRRKADAEPRRDADSEAPRRTAVGGAELDDAAAHRPEASRRKADGEPRRDADSETPRQPAVGGAELEARRATDEPSTPDGAAAHRPRQTTANPAGRDPARNGAADADRAARPDGTAPAAEHAVRALFEDCFVTEFVEVHLPGAAALERLVAAEECARSALRADESDLRCDALALRLREPRPDPTKPGETLAAARCGVAAQIAAREAEARLRLAAEEHAEVLGTCLGLFAAGREAAGCPRCAGLGARVEELTLAAAQMEGREAEHRQREKLVSRLRCVLRFSQLKKDSDRLHVVEAEAAAARSQLSTQDMHARLVSGQLTELDRLREIERDYLQLLKTHPSILTADPPRRHKGRREPSGSPADADAHRKGGAKGKKKAQRPSASPPPPAGAGGVAEEPAKAGDARRKFAPSLKGMVYGDAAHARGAPPQDVVAPPRGPGWAPALAEGEEAEAGRTSDGGESDRRRRRPHPHQPGAARPGGRHAEAAGGDAANRDRRRSEPAGATLSPHQRRAHQARRRCNPDDPLAKTATRGPEAHPAAERWQGHPASESDSEEDATDSEDDPSFPKPAGACAVDEGEESSPESSNGLAAAAEGADGIVSSDVSFTSICHRMQLWLDRQGTQPTSKAGPPRLPVTPGQSARSGRHAVVAASHPGLDLRLSSLPASQKRPATGQSRRLPSHQHAAHPVFTNTFNSLPRPGPETARLPLNTTHPPTTPSRPGRLERVLSAPSKRRLSTHVHSTAVAAGGPLPPRAAQRVK